MEMILNRISLHSFAESLLAVQRGMNVSVSPRDMLTYVERRRKTLQQLGTTRLEPTPAPGSTCQPPSKKIGVAPFGIEVIAPVLSFVLHLEGIPILV